MNTRTNSQAFAHDLAWGVAQDGAAAHEVEVTDLVEMAIGNGLVPAAAEVLADRSAPEIVRQRAFGLVTAALAALAAGQAQRGPVLADAA